VTAGPILAIQRVSRNFGGLTAVSDVSLEIPRSSIFALIGPNGSGKTTLFNVITGILSPSAGAILFDGQPITGAKTHEIVRRGVGRTFQNIRLFSRLSVFQNVWLALRRTPRDGGARRGERERVEELLELTGLAARRDELAENLNFGEQRRLELARALATDPVLLLLDEPAAGMSAAELGHLMADIRRLRERGTTIFLIEHTMDLVMGIADRIAVLNFGEKIAEGTPVEIQGNPRVIEAYLGRERAAHG
jgi:ABC-type branched-subunit amino acid transport system ATPase component